MQTMITVTREDIEGGIRGDERQCAIAIAAQRLFEDVIVAEDVLQIQGDFFNVSVSLSDWIRYFDAGIGTVDPIQVILDRRRMLATCRKGDQP